MLNTGRKPIGQFVTISDQDFCPQSHALEHVERHVAVALIPCLSLWLIKCEERSCEKYVSVLKYFQNPSPHQRFPKQPQPFGKFLPILFLSVILY